MPVSADFYSLTENSHRLVLNLIRITGEISGAEIARNTGFQPSTILYVLRILDKKGFIDISRTGSSTERGGKKPVLWKIKPGIGRMLGVEVLRNKIRYVKLDFAGTLYEQGEKPLPAAFTEGNILETLATVIQDIMPNNELNSKSFLGIGIGVPGLVNSDKGILQYSALLQVKNIAIGDQLSRILGKPVYVVNDANAGALSISWYNDQVSEKLPEHIVYLTYNNGSKNLGAGLVIDHELYTGIAGTAGEIFNPLPDLGELIKTSIKKIGHQHALLADNDRPEKVSFRTLVEYANKGCKLSSLTVDKVCDFISEEIARLAGLLNPNLIVLGGDITCSNELLSGRILPRTARKASKMIKMGFVLPEICFSSYGEYSVAIGTTAMILRKVIKSQNYKSR
jgi:N-acetylglucosamine repressor